jgi:hypothetical protein
MNASYGGFEGADRATAAMGAGVGDIGICAWVCVRVCVWIRVWVRVWVHGRCVLAFVLSSRL